MWPLYGASQWPSASLKTLHKSFPQGRGRRLHLKHPNEVEAITPSLSPMLLVFCSCCPPLGSHAPHKLRRKCMRKAAPGRCVCPHAGHARDSAAATGWIRLALKRLGWLARQSAHACIRMPGPLAPHREGQLQQPSLWIPSSHVATSLVSSSQVAGRLLPIHIWGFPQ